MTCQADVYGESAWSPHRCTRKAVTAAGYCKQHDPELKRQQKKKRGPTRGEQGMAARKRRSWRPWNPTPEPRGTCSRRRRRSSTSCGGDG